MLLLVAVLGGCTTGDWNEDSLFFSRKLADQTLADQRAEVQRKRTQLVELQDRASLLEREIEEAKRANEVRDEDLARYRRRVDALSRQLSALKAELGKATTSAAARTQAQADLQLEIDRLEKRVRDMRRDLLVLLENS